MKSKAFKKSFYNQAAQYFLAYIFFKNTRNFDSNNNIINNISDLDTMCGRASEVIVCVFEDEAREKVFGRKDPLLVAVRVSKYSLT